MKDINQSIWDYFFEKWNILGYVSSVAAILFTHYEIMFGFLGSAIFLFFSVRAKWLQSKHEKAQEKREQEMHELNKKLLSERIEQQEQITNDLKNNKK